MRRPERKLWLPPEGAEAAGRANSTAPEASRLQNNSGEVGDPDTDLDVLTRQYEAEAEAAKAEALGEARTMALQSRGMAERRSDALATPLSSDTKGFQMLAAMGYREGQGIGKTVIGRATPVDVNLKAGRTGLGVDEAKRRRADVAYRERQDREAKRLRGQGDMRSTFLHGRGASFAKRRASDHLASARVVCETLDQRAGISESCMWPLLPPAEEDAAAEASAEGGEAEGGGWEDLPVEEQLSSVLDHVRERHFYCFFCGCQYQDEEDLRMSCPGKWEDDH